MKSSASGSFLQTCINFVEERLKFSHFEGSIITLVTSISISEGFCLKVPCLPKANSNNSPCKINFLEL